MTIRALLIISLLFTSCRTIETKYGRDGISPIHASQKQKAKTENPKTIVAKSDIKITSEVEEDVIDKIEPSLVTEDNLSTSLQASKVEVPLETELKTDTVSIEKLGDALWAEDQSSLSLGFSIASLVSSYIAPLGLLLLIPAFIFYRRGNNSRYITKRGERRLRSAKILMIISTILAVAWGGFLVLAFIFF